MSFRTLKFAWIVGGVGLGTLLSVHGQQPPPRRGQPIIFSEPRHETATSNLNEIVTQKRTFPRLGEEFKKPSDISDVGDPGANILTPPMRQLPRPNVNSKHLKELYDKRNDRAFQTPEDQVTGLTAEEIFKIPELGPDGQEKKKARPMERYDQRLEREQHGNTNTNQMKGDELFDRQKQNDSRDDPTFARTQPTPSPGAITTVPTLKPLFGGDSISAYSADMNKARSWSENLGFANVEPPEVTRARETRLQNYKQLLDSGALAPPVTSGAANLPGTPAAAQGFNPSRALDSLPGATPPSSSSLLPRTTVGAPVGFGGNHQIVTPPPAPRMPLPPPAFEVPKRKF